MDTTLLTIAQESIVKYQSAVLEEDTQDCANFLLSLKFNRNVTPEPSICGTEQTVTTRPTPSKNFISAYDSDDNSPSLMDEHAELNLESLISSGESLVCIDDRDLVPDALFVAMAQMKVVNLTESDKVGCYKSRPSGFVGLGCKHCGGQPGFGKYFPESVRSLAQTTTSQTILKHIGSKCRYCPPEVRQAVIDLQHQQAIKEASIAGRPRYGSRKIFFQRIWGRLHNEPIPEYATKEPLQSVQLSPGHMFIADNTRLIPLIPSGIAQESADDDVSTTTEGSNDEQSSAKATRRYGGLPTKKNLMKRKQLADTESDGSPKRQRVERIGGSSTFV